MLFLTIFNADIDIYAWNLQSKSYTTRNIFPAIRWVKLIGKKEFVIAALDPKHQTFVVYVTPLNINLGNEVYLLKRVQIAHLKVDKALIKVFSKYVNSKDVFLLILAIKLLKYTRINNHTIKLVDNWQPPYSSIYSLGSIEL